MAKETLAPSPLTLGNPGLGRKSALLKVTLQIRAGLG